MDNTSLSISFGASLRDDAITCLGDVTEFGLDAIMDDGLLKDFPILSTAIAIYKIGNSVVERYNMKKILVFLREINSGIVDEEKRVQYQQQFKSDEKFRNKEIEYLLVLIDRYMTYEKPKMLAKLYLAYLDRIIIWEELIMYAEVIDRFLLLDCQTLISSNAKVTVHRNIGGESILRLVALGLMTEVTDTSAFIDDGNGGYALTWGSLSRSHN